MILQELYDELKTHGYEVVLDIKMTSRDYITIHAQIGNKHFGETFSADAQLTSDYNMFVKHVREAFEEGTI